MRNVVKEAVWGFTYPALAAFKYLREARPVLSKSSCRYFWRCANVWGFFESADICAAVENGFSKANQWTCGNHRTRDGAKRLHVPLFRQEKIFAH